MSAPDTPATAETRELVISRLIDASRERILEAWTQPELLAQWWGPHGFTTPECEMDPRPGGIFRTVMRAPDGTEYPGTGVFLEVTHERIVFTDAYGPGWEPSGQPFFTSVVTLEEQDGKTLYTARARHWRAEDCKMHAEMGFEKGWGESLERLEALVTTGQA